MKFFLNWHPWSVIRDLGVPNAPAVGVAEFVERRRAEETAVAGLFEKAAFPVADGIGPPKN
jgi:hypothetical protein